MASIFTKIISGEIPCHKIAENEKYFAFLDISPVARGHTLVVPKKEIDYIFDLDDELLSGLHIFSKRVAKAIEQIVPCVRVGVAVMGLEVPHAHIHLIPFHTTSDFNFSKKTAITTPELAELAEKIRQKFV